MQNTNGWIYSVAMPIIVKWYDTEKQNICYEVVGRWTWEDLFVAIDEAVQLLDTVDYPVNLILDMTQTSHVPTLAVREMGKVANAPTMSHPNTKKLLVVGANSYIEIMLNVFKKVFPNAGERYLIFHDFDAVRSFLAEEINN